jgi:hypothetical protein
MSLSTAKAFMTEGLTHRAKALSLLDGVADALDADPESTPEGRHRRLTSLRRARRSRLVSGRVLHDAGGKTPFTKILDREFSLVAPNIANARAAGDATLNHKTERLSGRLCSGG